MEGESEAIRALDWRIRVVQAQIDDAKRQRDFHQRRIDTLANTRRDLWRERRLQRQREAKATKREGEVKAR